MAIRSQTHSPIDSPATEGKKTNLTGSASPFFIDNFEEVIRHAGLLKDVLPNLGEDGVGGEEGGVVEQLVGCRQSPVEGVGVLTPVPDARRVQVMNAFVVVVGPPGWMTEASEACHLQ